MKRKNFEKGDLVLCAVEHIRRRTLASKFNLKYEGPYIVHKVNESGYHKLINLKNNAITAPINFQYIICKIHYLILRHLEKHSSRNFTAFILAVFHY